MRKTMPVRECMSRLPAEVDRRDRLEEAVAHMRAHHYHHVPVMDGPHIHGILSSQDLYERALSPGGSKPRVVGDVCTRDPLTVAPTTPIVEVARAMRDRRVSSVLVADGGVLVGIFTTTDALHLIADL